MRRLFAVLLWLGYLAAVILGAASIWTARGADLSTRLGGLAGLTAFGTLVGLVLGGFTIAVLLDR